MTKATFPRKITHRDVKLGDVVSLDFPYRGWDLAKVTKIDERQFTVFRPHMNSNDEYPYVGVEIFTLWRDSDKTLTLISRVGEY